MNHIVDFASSGYYAASALYQPITVPGNVKHILKAQVANDHEKKIEHTVKVINAPILAGYNTSMCGISVSMITATQFIALDILKIASAVTGFVGVVASAIASIPEMLGFARSIRLEGNIDVTQPEKTLAWIKERYLSDDLGKVKLERRVGKWLADELEIALKPAEVDPNGELPIEKPALTAEKAKELVEQVLEQNRKKMLIHGLGILAIAFSVITILAIGFAVPFLYLFPVYILFTAFLVGQYVMTNCVFTHKGWDVDKSGLIPEWIKTQAARFSKFLSEGWSVPTNEAIEEKVCPLKVKSSS